MKKLSILALTGLLVISHTAAAKTVFNDNFADGGRNNGADQSDTNWFTTTSGGAIEVSKGSLGLVSGTSGRGIRATFAPQSIPVGSSITSSFTFTTPQTIGKKDSAFRVGMYNKSGRQGLESDLSASSKKLNPLYDGLPGYMIDFDVNPKGKANIDIRKRVSATGRLLGTTKGYKSLGGGGSVYTFKPGQTYTGTMTIKNLAAGVQVSATLKHQGKIISQHNAIDKGASANNIGMLAFHVNSKTFGSSNKKNTPDNGIDFKNVRVDVLP